MERLRPWMVLLVAADVAIIDVLEHSQPRVEVTDQRRSDLRTCLLSL
ncbi:MAG: hypothetical protein ACRBN8_42880 [Nannocystales bacterium]